MDPPRLSASAVAEHFGLGGDPVLQGPVARGEQGTVWRLTTDEGTWAVKQWFDEPVDSQIEEGAAFCDAAVRCGVPAPRPVRGGDGWVLGRLSDGVVRVLPWVDLQGPSTRLDPSAVGAVLARLYRVPFAGTAPQHGWYTDAVGRDRWSGLARAATEAGAPFAEQLAAYVPELVALEGLLRPAREMRTCHRDLWSDNVLRTSSGDLCVIDWEDCGLADPAQELVCVLFEYGCGDPERIRTLHDAYCAGGGPGRVVDAGDASMLVAQLGHIGARHVRMWLEAPVGSPVRRRAEAGVDEFVSTPLTRDVVSGVLDALRS